jgi:hypothetical protein
MKKILPILIFILCGCSQPSNTASTPTPKDGCPDQPQGTLETKSVKSITLSNNSLTESGQINPGKQKGFTFDAKKGQKLSYRTKDDICVWVYTPNSNLFKEDELPVDGKYTVQVSALKGSTSFALDMELKDPGVAQQPSPSPSVVAESTTSTSSTPVQSSSTSTSSTSTATTSNRSNAKSSPEQFIRDHYSNLNARNYNSTWKGLSSDFQGISGSFSGYTEWWDSVEKIELGSVRLVSQDDNEAIVDAEITYVMKTGSAVDDERGRIYLTWNSNKENWEIAKKK